MQEFKSPVIRLARLFKKGRDNWKEKALEKQALVRNLEIKVRDLTNSRSNWKARALAAEKKLKLLKIEGDVEAKKPDVNRRKRT
jgi:hypothetical protein